jgi:hypothetical protein
MLPEDDRVPDRETHSLVHFPQEYAQGFVLVVREIGVGQVQAGDADRPGLFQIG